MIKNDNCFFKLVFYLEYLILFNGINTEKNNRNKIITKIIKILVADKYNIGINIFISLEI